jgi:hypothetical protein
MNLGAIALTVSPHDARHAAYRLTLPLSDPRCQARINLRSRLARRRLASAAARSSSPIAAFRLIPDLAAANDDRAP